MKQGLSKLVGSNLKHGDRVSSGDGPEMPSDLDGQGAEVEVRCEGVVELGQVADWQVAVELAVRNQQFWPVGKES